MIHKKMKAKKRSPSLADDFAKAAIQGMMVNFGPDDEYTVQDIARIAYELADEMIKARQDYREMNRLRKKTPHLFSKSTQPKGLELTE